MEILRGSAMLAALTASVLGIASPSAAASQQLAPSRNYATPQSAVAVSQEQCAKPIKHRRANWACFVTQSISTRASRPGDTRSNSARQIGYCNIQACWDVYTVTYSDFETRIVFGFNDQELGQAICVFEVTLNGAQSISSPVAFTPTTTVSSLTMEGDRLYYSPAHPEGAPVRPSVYNFYTRGPVAQAERAEWIPNGYKAYENTVQTGSVVHQWTWTMAEYPGTWWVYGKSVKFDLTSSSYRFGSPNYLGQQPTEAGYNLG